MNPPVPVCVYTPLSEPNSPLVRVQPVAEPERDTNSHGHMWVCLYPNKTHKERKTKNPVDKQTEGSSTDRKKTAGTWGSLLALPLSRPLAGAWVPHVYS